MTDRIHVGTMLIQDGTRMPSTVVVSTEHYSVDWSSIMGSSSAQLGREIANAGWTFFYMAGQIGRNGFGFSDQSRVGRAVGHLIKAVKLQNCNCLEITEIRQRSFLGLPYTTLVNHARHIQESRSFSNQSQLPIHAGAEIFVAEGPHKGVRGIFLGLEDQLEWAAIEETDGAVSRHPVAWLRSHQRLLCYTSLTGRQNG